MFEIFVQEALGAPEDSPAVTEEVPENLTDFRPDPVTSSHGYFMALGADHLGPDLVKAPKDEFPVLGYADHNRPPVERVLVKEGAKFGAYVSMARTKYGCGECADCVFLDKSPSAMV
jgi:hypothetical protein